MGYIQKNEEHATVVAVTIVAKMEDDDNENSDIIFKLILSKNEKTMNHFHLEKMYLFSWNHHLFFYDPKSETLYKQT